MRPSDQRRRDRQRDLAVLEHGGRREIDGLVDAARRGALSRRQFLFKGLELGLSVSAVATLLAACGKKSDGASPSAGAATYATVKPDKVVYYGWSDCMDPETPKLFEQQTGIKMVCSAFDDNEALLAKLKAGATGYDVITPSDYMVSVMIKSDLVLPLDMSLLPNFKYVVPKFRRPPYDDESDGKKYSTPWMWGTTGIGYRTDKVTATVDSWAILWDPAYKGQIVMLNDERETMAAGLIYTGHSINTTVQAELDEATQALIEQKPLVQKYDSLNCKRNMVAGTPLSQAWNGDVLLAYGAVGDKIAFVLPKEGFPLWSDGCMIPDGAPSPYSAHLLMDFFILPENAARIVNYAGYSIPIEGIDTYLEPVFVKFYPQPAELDRGQLYTDLGEFARNYTTAWARVKAS
jgi:spermidine/putrescine transport system substrate-binding protein